MIKFNQGAELGANIFTPAGNLFPPRKIGFQSIAEVLQFADFSSVSASVASAMPMTHRQVSSPCPRKLRIRLISSSENPRDCALLMNFNCFKAESGGIVKVLQDRGIEVVLLTGDHSEVAQTVAKKLNITTAHARMNPEGKLAIR